MAGTLVHPAEGRTIVGIVQDIVRDVQEVFRSELRLARVEVTEKAHVAAKAGGILGVAAVTGLLGGAGLVTTIIAALALVLPVWAAALIVSVLLLCIAGGCYAAGRGRLSRVKPVPQETVKTLKDDIRWAIERRR